MFCAPNLFSAVPRASGSFFMFCAPGLIFGGTEGVGSRFHVLRARARFWRYRGRRVSFSSFALPDSFSAVPRASGPVFMFCAPRLVFGGTDGVGSFFYLPARTHFRLYRRRRVPFSAVSRASGPVFHVFHARTRFRRYRGHPIPFSCFARPESYSAIRGASGPVIMFCAPRLIFGGTDGVGSRFQVLRSQTRFRRYGGRRVPFSCFAISDSFSAVLMASGPVFMFFVPRIVFCSTEGVGSHFHVLHTRAGIRRYRWRRVPFSSFELPDSFSAVPRASGPVIMFCAPDSFRWY
jgi:hypothetical protein